MDPLVLTEGKPCLMAYSRAVLAGWDRASVSHSSRDRRPQQHAMKACGPCVPFKIQYLPVIGRAIRYLRVEGASSGNKGQHCKVACGRSVHCLRGVGANRVGESVHFV